MLFSELIDARALLAPQAPALRDDAHEYNNGQLRGKVHDAANVLTARGVRRGDVVAILLSNRVELVVALLASWYLGAAVTPINPVLGSAEVAYQATDAGARVIVAQTVLDGIETVLVDDLAHTSDLARTPEPLTDSDLALLIYTSGTTGTPKGVMLTHGNLDAMTASFAQWLEIDESDHSLLVLPLFHANGIVLGTLTPLRAGGQVSITGRFSRDRFFDDVQRLRPTYFSAVPAIYSLLSSLPEDVRPDTASVRFGVCGAAPMPAEAIARFEEWFGITLVEGYGLSETTCASTINPLRSTRKPGTVGLALPGQRVRVVNEEGVEVATGERGEIVISGPVVMAGYFGKPEETAKALRDGWLHTGDIGVFDEEGYLRIVDRIKDMIIRGGENIYPKEIENALYAHNDVREAAVVGRADEVMGEVPVAFVAIREGVDVTTDDLNAHLERVLASYKRPEFIEIVTEVPKNPVGKIDKPALRLMRNERTP